MNALFGRINTARGNFLMFYVLLTVHPVQLWVNDQLDAQLRYKKRLLL